jgi:hypothetical protein
MRSHIIAVIITRITKWVMRAGNDAKRSLSLKHVKHFVLRSVYEKGSNTLGFGNRKYLHLMINATLSYTAYLKIHRSCDGADVFASSFGRLARDRKVQTVTSCVIVLGHTDKE